MSLDPKPVSSGLARFPYALLLERRILDRRRKNAVPGRRGIQTVLATPGLRLAGAVFLWLGLVCPLIGCVSAGGAGQESSTRATPPPAPSATSSAEEEKTGMGPKTDPEMDSGTGTAADPGTASDSGAVVDDAPTTTVKTPPREGKKGRREILPEPVLEPIEHLRLAREAWEVGDTDSAFDHWEHALVGEPNELRWGADYRQAVIAEKAYGRSLDFWQALVEANPEKPNARLNLGYAYVDKVPVEGAITGVILANKALGEFTAALELEETWLGYYTRGNSYMYWPAIFGRTEHGIADLEKAITMAEKIQPRMYHGQAWAALGDGYWRLGQRERMHQIWQEGAQLYPQTSQLKERLSREGEELDTWLETHFEPTTRVATDLGELWQEEPDR